jgi:hypothetical protein
VVRYEKARSPKFMCSVDPTVRAAAAKAIRVYHDEETAKALALLFMDPKKPVQFSGAAAYLVCVGAVAMPPRTPQPQ